MTTEDLALIAVRFPRFTISRVTWADRPFAQKPDGLENGWWAVATQEGGYYSFGATIDDAVRNAVDDWIERP